MLLHGECLLSLLPRYNYQWLYGPVCHVWPPDLPKHHVAALWLATYTIRDSRMWPMAYADHRVAHLHYLMMIDPTVWSAQKARRPGWSPHLFGSAGWLELHRLWDCSFLHGKLGTSGAGGTSGLIANLGKNTFTFWNSHCITHKSFTLIWKWIKFGWHCQSHLLTMSLCANARLA